MVDVVVIHEHWFVFWGDSDPQKANTVERDDEEDCREFIRLIGCASDCGIARQLRYVGPMEMVEAPGG